MFHTFCVITTRDCHKVSVGARHLIRMAGYFGGNSDHPKDFYAIFQPKIESLLMKSKFQLCVRSPKLYLEILV